MYYIVITKKQNVCYNFFESLYSFAHFKCKCYILYSKLLLQWAVREKKISQVPNLKKLYLQIFKYHIEKICVDYFQSKKAKKNISSKKNVDCKSPMKWPICTNNVYRTVCMHHWQQLIYQYFIKHYQWLSLDHNFCKRFQEPFNKLHD